MTAFHFFSFFTGKKEKSFPTVTGTWQKNNFQPSSSPPQVSPAEGAFYSISLSLYPPSGEQEQGLQPLLLSNSATALHHQVQIAPIIFSLTNLGAAVIIGSSRDNKTIIHRPVS